MPTSATLPAYRSPHLTPGQQRALDQGLLPFMLRFGGKTTVRVEEASKELGMSADFIRDLIDLGELEHINAKAKGDRPTYIIATRSLLLWCLKNSNVDPAELEDHLRQLLNLYGVGTLKLIIALATARLERISK